MQYFISMCITATRRYKVSKPRPRSKLKSFSSCTLILLLAQSLGSCLLTRKLNIRHNYINLFINIPQKACLTYHKINNRIFFATRRN